MDSGNTTTLHDYATGTKKKFTFDYNYWSLGDPHSSKFAPQEKIFADLGAPQLDHALPWLQRMRVCLRADLFRQNPHDDGTPQAQQTTASSRLPPG